MGGLDLLGAVHQFLDIPVGPNKFALEKSSLGGSQPNTKVARERRCCGSAVNVCARTEKTICSGTYDHQSC